MKWKKNVDRNTKTKLADQGKKITKPNKKATMETEVHEHNLKQAIVNDEMSKGFLLTSQVRHDTSRSSASSASSSVGINNCGVMEGWEDEYGEWLRGGVVDEQMSWGSTWMPFWDVEYMGEACGEMFSDVMWDDDIWNLRHLDNLPNP